MDAARTQHNRVLREIILLGLKGHVKQHFLQKSRKPAGKQVPTHETSFSQTHSP